MWFLNTSHSVHLFCCDSRAKAKVKSLSCVWLFVTPWTIAYQASPSMGFSRQEHWSGLPFPPPGDLPDSGIEPRTPALQTDTFTIWATREVCCDETSEKIWNFYLSNLCQGIFPTQELNPSLPHCRWILYQLSHQGSPIRCDSSLYNLYLWGCHS